jgi:hypothetical protein
MNLELDLSTMLPGVVRNLKKSGFDSDTMNHTANLLSDYKVESIHRDGNFMVVLIGNKMGRSYVGVSKRNPLDKFNPKRGGHVAAARALANALIDLSGVGVDSTTYVESTGNPAVAVANS